MIAIPDDPEIMYRLHCNGIPTPDLMQDYDWPHGLKETWRDSPEQKVVSNFLVKNPRSFLLSDPRTGKTISTLWAIEWLLTRALKGRSALVLAPKSTLQDVWAAEIDRHFQGRLKVAVLKDAPQRRLKYLKEKADIYVTNYETVNVGATIGRDKSRRLVLVLKPNSVAEHLFNRDDIQIVAIDEATTYKNLNTIRAWILRKFLNDKKYVWAITGTPTPNSPLDAYSLAKLIRTNFIELKKDYKAKTMVQLSEFQWATLPGADAHAARVLQPHVRYAYGDVFDADRQDFILNKVNLTPTQDAAIRTFTRDKLLELKEGKLTMENEGAARLKFLQMASGGVYTGDGAVSFFPPIPKLIDLFKFIGSRPKSLVFIPFTFCAQLIIDYNPHYQFEYITSDMNDFKRAQAFDRFRTEPLKRFIMADARIMSHGLNLSVADTIIWFGPTDRAESFQQANRRVVKPGARTKVIGLYSTRLEKGVYDRQRNKENFQGLVMDELRRYTEESEL